MLCIFILDTSHFVFHVFVTGLCSFAFFWFLATVFLIFDVTGSFQQYKVEKRSDEFKWQPAIRAILSTIFNQLVFGLSLSAAFYQWSVRGLERQPSKEDMLNVQPFHIVLRDALVTVYMYEFTFYPLHRLMHWKPIYNSVHKIHHEWRNPISVAAIHNHPLEYVTGGFIPVMAGPVMMGSHISSIWLFVAVVLISNVSEHSGYHIPFVRSARFHYFHHTHINECLGANGLLDYIFGTDKQFRKSKHFAKHRVFFTTIKAESDHDR